MENLIHITSHMNGFNYLRLITEEQVKTFYYQSKFCPEEKLLSKGLTEVSDLLNGGCKLISTTITEMEKIICNEYIYFLSKENNMISRDEYKNEFCYCILRIFREFLDFPIESADEIYLISDGKNTPVYKEIKEKDKYLSIPKIFDERNSLLSKVLSKLNELGLQGWNVVDFHRTVTHKIKEYYSDEYLWLLKK